MTKLQKMEDNDNKLSNVKSLNLTNIENLNQYDKCTKDIVELNMMDKNSFKGINKNPRRSQTLMMNTKQNAKFDTSLFNTNMTKLETN